MASAPATQSTNSGILIQGNTINHNDFAHFDPGFGSGGIKVGATSGIVLRGNTIQNNEGSGIHFDEDSGNELVDGNTVTDNSDADGMGQELGFGVSIFRNNVVLRNGAHVNDNNWAYQIAVHASTGVDVYCNVIEVPTGEASRVWGIAAPRGSSHFPPFQYRVTTGNFFHHNTVIWDPGLRAKSDTARTTPNTSPTSSPRISRRTITNIIYPARLRPTLSSTTTTVAATNSRPSATIRPRARMCHSTVDSNNTSGYPEVSITSPGDQSSVS